MTTKKSPPVHYTNKEISDLKQIKRDYPRAHARTQAIKAWAKANNRPFKAVRAKMGKIHVRIVHPKAVTPPTVVPVTVQQPPQNFPSPSTNTGIREVRLPIQSWKIENNELVITY